MVHIRFADWENNVGFYRSGRITQVLVYAGSTILAKLVSLLVIWNIG